MRLKVAVLLVLAFTICINAQIQPSISVDAPRATNDWLRIHSSTHAKTLLTLQATTNFQSWTTVGTTHEKFWNFPTRPDGDRGVFYRLRAQNLTSNDDWKNELLFPDERLRSPDGQELRWVKFTILLDDPTRVYFQDSVKFPFHYDFAAQRLAPFVGLDRAAFDALSLHRTNQQIVLGSILYPPSPDYVEYGVQFVGLDPYTPDEISRWFDLVKASIYATNGAGAYYMPVFEQAEMVRTNAAAFQSKGVSIGSIDRWIAQDHVYSPGWAIGRLKFFPAAEISAAFSDGRLQPSDILLTDGVPAETPVVAGIISLTPSTPNSHTAILSQSFGIPFVYLQDPADQSRVQSLINHKVILRAITGWSGSMVKFIDVENSLAPIVEAELLALKKSAPIQYMPKQSFGTISASTENLGPADIKFFGGKAANYGLLRDAVPTNSPPAIAFSFDLWDAFMDQQLSSGLTLRESIAQILAPYTTYPPNIPELKTGLATIRDMIRREASFTPTQKETITNALTIFNAKRNIRFRSSTNVEDSDSFTGAGLYDSFSGCLADDIDGDTSGPCLCDPTENNERGVFRAIQRVYASFYNDNAFVERLRHGVNESEVAMGVLVHHSFPDEEELANGVATINYSSGGYSDGQMVTQLGADSVTNPTGASLPEVVRMSNFGFSYFLTLTRYSSVVPLGAHVMQWQDDHASDDYIGFLKLFGDVSRRYQEVFPKKANFTLDFEYKKDTNMGLVIKQVRPIPPPPATAQTTAFLINEPTTYRVYCGEFGDVFAFHRSKSIWSLETPSFKMVPTNLTQGLYRNGSVQYLSNNVPASLAGSLTTWPNASVSSDGITNFWTTGAGTDQLKWRLETYYHTNVNSGEPPLLTQQDFQVTLVVDYPRPMLKLDYDTTPMTTTQDVVFLRPFIGHEPSDITREYSFQTPTGVTIGTKFYWPKPPTGVVAGYTAPLVEFVETKIAGLTPNPITLTDYYSQTYHPFHHNFSEEFLFEPRLDPNVSASDIAALEAANIRQIYVKRNVEGPPVFKAVSAAGTFRDL